MLKILLFINHFFPTLIRIFLRSKVRKLLCWTVLLMICSSSCKTPNLPKEKMILIEDPEKLTISKIRCLNLAEKLVGIGSKNDEILLLIYQVNSKKEISFLWSTDIFIFENENSEGSALNKSFPLNKETLPSEFKFILLEIDTERTKEDLSELVEKLLTQNLPEATIKDKIREDDLLGIKTLSFAKASKYGKLKFSGMHLFDKYHYEIEYSFE